MFWQSDVFTWYEFIGKLNMNFGTKCEPLAWTGVSGHQRNENSTVSAAFATTWQPSGNHPKHSWQKNTTIQQPWITSDNHHLRFARQDTEDIMCIYTIAFLLEILKKKDLGGTSSLLSKKDPCLHHPPLTNKYSLCVKRQCNMAGAQ